jgi:uncharacterized membrane protein
MLPSENGGAVHFETIVQVDAPASLVWQAVADVERWPEWTPTINEVTWLTGAGADDAIAGPLRPGGRARIRQPRLPELIWEVTAVNPGSSFTWRAKTAGVAAVGTHQVRPLTEDRAELTLGLSQLGPLAPILGLLARRRTRSYLQQEAAGLKRCAEVAAR